MRNTEWDRDRDNDRQTERHNSVHGLVEGELMPGANYLTDYPLPPTPVVCFYLLIHFTEFLQLSKWTNSSPFPQPIFANPFPDYRFPGAATHGPYRAGSRLFCLAENNCILSSTMSAKGQYCAPVKSAPRANAQLTQKVLARRLLQSVELGYFSFASSKDRPWSALRLKLLEPVFVGECAEIDCAHSL